MVLTADVTAGQIIQSAWGNQIRDRTIQKFATRTDRDTQWAAPPKGAACTTDDCGDVLQLWTGTRWVARQVGYQVVTTDVNGRAGFAYPYPFKATPTLMATSAGDIGFLVVAGRSATAGTNTAANAFLYFWGVHYNPPRPYASVPIDVAWMAEGTF